MPRAKIIYTSGGISLCGVVSHFCCAFSFTVFGQDTRGSILGRVTDATGANVAGAEVHVSNVATGVSVTAKTNDSGNYNVPYLTPGSTPLPPSSPDSRNSSATTCRCASTTPSR